VDGCRNSATNVRQMRTADRINRSSATVKSRARQEHCDECHQQTGSVRTTYHAKEAKDGSDEEEGGEE
jgi:hypothetical protein